MKRALAYLCLAGLLLAACQTKPPSKPTLPLQPEDHAYIEEASRAFVEAYNANDWQALVMHFTPDAILMPPHDTAVTGREAIRGWKEANERGYRLALQIENIGGSGDTAYVRGEACTFVSIDADTYGVEVGKFLEVRKLQSDGSWLIDVDIFNADRPDRLELLDACPFADGWE